jgi:hypothetical protein
MAAALISMSNATVRSRARAWSRCQPVSSQSWSRIASFSALVPDRYAAAILFVTALRTPIESSIDLAQSGVSQAEGLGEATNRGRTRRFRMNQRASIPYL